MAVVNIVVLENGKRKLIEVDEINLQGFIANIEGGVADTLYLSDQCFDGGDSDGN